MNFYDHFDFLQACMIRYKALGKEKELKYLKFLYKERLNERMRNLYKYEKNSYTRKNIHI